MDTSPLCRPHFTIPYHWPLNVEKVTTKAIKIPHHAANAVPPSTHMHPLATRLSAWSSESHQIQCRLLQDVHHLLQLGVWREDEVIVHPQHILCHHLWHGQVSSRKPALRHAKKKPVLQQHFVTARAHTRTHTEDLAFPNGMMYCSMWGPPTGCGCSLSSAITIVTLG